MSTLRIGDYAINRIVEQELPFIHAREFFPDLTEDMLTACQRELPPGHLTAEGVLNMSFHAFLLRTGRHTILIDTCCGNGKDRAARPAFHRLDTPFLHTLAEAGVAPEQVDFVMCTHLHWDHVGWNTRLVDGRWVPTFPNAKYIVGRTEFEFWGDACRRGASPMHCSAFADSVLPVKKAEQVVLMAEDHELVPGVVLEPCFGHSPGHVVVNIASGGERAVATGDVVHHQVQLRFPTLSTVADADRNRARQTRTALLEKHADTGTVLLPAHFIAPTAGRLRRAAEGFRYAPVG